LVGTSDLAITTMLRFSLRRPGVIDPIYVAH